MQDVLDYVSQEFWGQGLFMYGKTICQNNKLMVTQFDSRH